MAGGSLITLVWVSNGYLAEVLNPSPAAVGALIVALGFLMVSSIPYRNFRDLRRNAYARYWLAMSLTACLAAALVWDVSMYWGLGALIYLTWGLVDGLVIATRHRLQQKDPAMATEDA